MKNPYTILKISQNATKQEIAKALIAAQRENIKTKAYSPQELLLAQKQLLDPAKRLVADFIFPTKYKTQRAKLIHLSNNQDAVNLADLKADALDSL